MFLAALRLFWRDKRTLFWVFAVPVVLLVFLGVIFDAPPRLVVGVVGRIEDPRLAAALQDLAAEGTFTVSHGERAAELRALGGGKRVVTVERIGGDIVLSYGRQPASRLAAARVEEAIQRRYGLKNAVTVEHRETRVGRGRYVDFLVPGLLALFLLTSGLYGLGYTTVQHRQSGILRRLKATPLGRWTYACAQIAARLCIETIQMGFILAVAGLTFGFRLAKPGLGSVVAAGALMLLGAFAFIGLGLLVGSRARSAEVVGGIASAINVPMMLLSGVFFAIDDVPGALAPVVRAMPLTYLTGGLRKVMTEGASLTGVGLELAVLAAWGLATLAAAVRLFRWE